MSFSSNFGPLKFVAIFGVGSDVICLTGGMLSVLTITPLIFSLSSL